MTMRIFGIELRRSAALLIGVLVLAVGLALLSMSNAPWNKTATAWTQQWTSLGQWMRVMLQFLWPLTVGAAAWQGRRDHRARMGELLTSTARPAWRRVSPLAIAMALGVGGAYVVMLIVGGVQVAGNASYNHLDWVPVALVGVLSLIAAAWLGMGLGRLLPSVLTPPVAAVVSLVAILLLANTPDSGMAVPLRSSHVAALFSPALAAARDPFVTLATQVSVGQLVWFAALAIAGFLLLVLDSARARLIAVLPVVLGVAVALPLFPAEASEVYVPDPAAGEQVCADGTPLVCVTKVHERELADLIGPAREALALLAKLSDAPTAVKEVPSTDAPSPDVVAVDFGAPEFQGLSQFPTRDHEQLLLAMIAGAGTRPCPGRDWQSHLRDTAARTVASAWLTGQLQPYPGSGSMLADAIQPLVAPAWQTLRSLPADQQRARVQALRAAAPTCRADLLHILTGSR